MLRAARRATSKATAGRFVIVASLYNPRYVNGLLRSAQSVFRSAGGPATVTRVPGSFEIPVAAAAWAQRAVDKPDGIVALGLLWRGETTHADLIGAAVTHGLMRIALETGVPVIHEVIIVADSAQARARCLDAETNRGAEAAHTALEMAAVMRRLRGPKTA